MKKMTSEDYLELEVAFESVLDTAMESVKGHILDPKVRDALPDRAFAVVYKGEDGNNVRKYPVVVQNDPEATHELVSKIIQHFHFCKPEWKPQVAKKIVQVIKSEKIKISISKKSQIFKYIDERDLPNTVTITDNSK